MCVSHTAMQVMNKITLSEAERALRIGPSIRRSSVNRPCSGQRQQLSCRRLWTRCRLLPSSAACLRKCSQEVSFVRHKHPHFTIWVPHGEAAARVPVPWQPAVCSTSPLPSPCDAMPRPPHRRLVCDVCTACLPACFLGIRSMCVYVTTTFQVGIPCADPCPPPPIPTLQWKPESGESLGPTQCHSVDNEGVQHSQRGACGDNAAVLRHRYGESPHRSMRVCPGVYVFRPVVL